MIIKFFGIKQKYKNYKEIIVLTSFLMLYFMRIVVIGYTETKICPAINIISLSSTYSLQFGFEILSLVFGVIEVRKF